MKEQIGIFILIILLVAGVFYYAALDQTALAATETETDIRLERSPEAVQTGADLGMALAVKVASGALVSLLLAGAALVWQNAKLRELRDGGYARFWERRRVPKEKESKAKAPSALDLMAMIWTDEVMKRRRS